MELYFFRHAIAQNPDGRTPDHLRELTKEGIENTRIAAPVVKRLDLKLTHLYSSPLIRARQTADILAEALGIEVEVRQEIGPGFNRTAIERLMQEMTENGAVMFVGHEPDFSQTLAQLTGGRIDVKKGSLARVDVVSYSPLSGDLAYLLPPKVFKLLG